MKKIVSIFLAVLMLLSCLGAIASAAEHCNVTPIVFCYGDSSIYWKDEDGKEHELYDDGEYVSAILKNCIPDLVKGIATGNYDEYCKKVLDIMLPAFEHLTPDLEGNLPPESYIGSTFNASTARWVNHTRYAVDDNPSYVYGFRIDQRRSPLDVAEDLNDYIQAIKKLTGHSKVAIVARCLGPVAVFPYLQKYQRENNYEDIESLTIIATTANGIGYGEAAYTGNVDLQADGVNMLLKDYYTQEGFVDETLAELIDATVEVLEDSYGLVLTVDQVNKLYKALKDKLFAPFIKEYYARQLSYVACIKENYDDLIPYLFSEEGDDVKYAYYINKIQEYHDTVQVNIDDMLLELNKQQKVNIIAYYGIRHAFPLSEDCMLTGDYKVGVRQQSWGATVSKVNSTLSDKYIQSRIDAGYERYISPDRQIDASTCLLPDHTFFVRNCDHQWPPQVYALVTLLVRNSKADINTYEQYPQFMNYDPNVSTLLPAQENNSNDLDYNTTIDKGEAYSNFFQIINQYLVKIYNKVFDFIKKFAQMIHSISN